MNDRSVYDNLLFVLKATGWKNAADIENKINSVLEKVDMKTKGFKMPYQLSGGEQQRVAIARALLNNPEMILADEPTGNLDSANANELHHLFFILREEFGQTFLIVTHNEELAAMSDRVLHMKDGKIVESQSP